MLNQKLKNGMISRKFKELTQKDICEIIKICGDSGVHEIKFKDLKISFKTKEENGSTALNQQSHVEEIQKNLIIEDAKLLHELEHRQKEDELANMPIEDPTSYEQGLAQGDFVDKGDADADTDRR